MKRIDELDKSMEEPGFWDDPETSTRLMRESKNLKDTVESYNKLEQEYEDIQVMIEMGYEENDPALVPEIRDMMDDFVEKLEAIRIQTLLSGEYDNNDAILKLNAGAGAQRPATGAACCTGCTRDGRTERALPPLLSTIWTARRPALNPLPSRLPEKMPTVF